MKSTVSQAPPPLFHLAPQEWQPPYELKGPEHHHLKHVLRIQAGDMVRCFDGRGRVGLFTVASLDKHRAALDLSAEHVMPRPSSRMSLALAWSKGLRRGWLLEKCAELEADRILFWQARRSVGTVPDTPKAAMINQLVAGAKQSDNAWLPEVLCLSGGAQGVAQYCKNFDHFFFLWEKSGPECLLAPERLTRKGTSLAIIGPEGGLDDLEVEVFTSHGVMPASLGERIVRWETAALLCLGLAFWGRNRQAASASKPE